MEQDRRFKPMIKTPVLPAIFLAAALGACQPPAEAPTDAPTTTEVSPPQPAPAAPAQASLPAQASDDWQVYAKPTDVQRLARLDSALRRFEARRLVGHTARLRPKSR